MERKFETRDPARSMLELQKEQYREILKKYDISLEQAEVCNLAEFLLTQHNEGYERNRAIYENNEALQKIYAVVDSKKELAVFVNVNEKGKIPQGEFGVYDFRNHKFEASKEIKEKIEKSIRQMTKNVFSEKEIKKMVENISPKTLDDMDKIATKDFEIQNRAKKEVDRMIDEKNNENGKDKSERSIIENKNMTEEAKEEQKKSINTLPKHIAKYCIMAGVIAPLAVIDTKATEAYDKIDEPRINRNGGNVTILKVRDDAKSIDKYLVFQDNKLIIPGNRDEKIDKVVGKKMQNSKNGSFIKPLDIDEEEQYFEYTDSQGLVIKEKLEESLNLSIEDLEEYKKEIKYELEKFSQEFYKIDETPFASDAQKDELRAKVNEGFNENNEKIALKYNINFEDVKEINLVTDEHTEEINNEFQDEDLEETEAWEVPGKRER